MQRAPVDAEDFGGARFVTAGHSQRLDRVSFSSSRSVILCSLARAIKAPVWPFERTRSGQIVGSKVRAGGKGAGALNHVLQLARCPATSMW